MLMGLFLFFSSRSTFNLALILSGCKIFFILDSLNIIFPNVFFYHYSVIWWSFFQERRILRSMKNLDDPGINVAKALAHHTCDPSVKHGIELPRKILPHSWQNSSPLKSQNLPTLLVPSPSRKWAALSRSSSSILLKQGLTWMLLNLKLLWKSSYKSEQAKVTTVYESF